MAVADPHERPVKAAVSFRRSKYAWARRALGSPSSSLARPHEIASICVDKAMTIETAVVFG
jgi:hypothetical protein